MKKLSVLIVMMIVGLSTISSAQKIAIEGHYGRSFSETSSDVNYSAINVYKIGATYTHDLGPVGVKTGILYGQKGRQIDNRLLGLAGMRDVTVVRYVEVPVMAVVEKAYSDKVYFYGGGGAYVGRATSAVNRMKAGVLKFEVSNDTKIGVGSKEGMVKPWDLGMQLEGGVRFGSIGVGLSYQYGFLDYSEKKGEQLNHRALMAHARYAF